MLKIFPALAWLWAAVAAHGADAPATFKVGEFTFTRPAGWELTGSTSEVVRAQLKLTGLGNGKRGEMKFMHGDLKPDGRPKSMTDLQFVNLVTNSFHRPYPTMEKNVAGHKLTFVNTRPASEATKPRPPAAQRTGAKVVFALMESKEGNVLIMFSGSKEIVEASEAEFRKMIESAAAAAPRADAPATFKVGEFTFTRPAKWEWTGSTSDVVRAELQLGKPTRMDSAQMTFFHEEPHPGGKPRSYADRRWAEIVRAKSERLPPNPDSDAMGFNYRYRFDETNVAGHKVTYVNLRPAAEVGKERKFPPQRPNSRQIFAFVESKEGNVFINFDGRIELLDDSEKEFRKMIESAAAGK